MASQYAGADLFPTDFLIPDDGDDEDATSVNVALEALGDRTIALQSHSPRLQVIEFLTSGTYAPAADSRIVAAWVVGCGGGGAELGVMPVSITPGQTYNVDIGAGGVSTGVAESDGGDGGDTIFRHGSTHLATFPGAAGGDGPAGGHVLTDVNSYSFGGLPVAGVPELVFGDATQCPRFDTTDTQWTSGGTLGFKLSLQPGQGGYGADGSTHPLASAGARNRTGGFAGGAAGVRGTDSSTHRGGGGGGGGGAGPFGVGGDGGNGGPHDGAADSGGGGAANSGAGGGGGGTGGYNSSTGQGPGGNGGSGRLRLVIATESP